jgi:DtxR family Mn-dependent transcriptional regulator
MGVVALGLGALLFVPRGGLLGRWRRMQSLSARVQREDLLKHLYSAELAGHPATAQSSAGALQINANRVVTLLQELTDAELVVTEGDTIHLTASGRDAARHILRAHRLWEQRLADETGYPEDEWHAQADVYEHALSPQETEALAAYLGNPLFDPHGDPIPTPEGEMATNGGVPLSELAPGQPAWITHLEDEPDVIYAQLVATGLYPGMRVRVLERTPQRVRFLAEGEEFVLAPIVAANVTAQPLPRDVPVAAPPGVSLDTLKTGEAARVVEISPRCRGQARRRLMDLGVLPGTVIHAEFASPAGDPIAFRVRGALIALRQEQSKFIHVEKLLEQA